MFGAGPASGDREPPRCVHVAERDWTPAAGKLGLSGRRAHVAAPPRRDEHPMGPPQEQEHGYSVSLNTVFYLLLAPTMHIKNYPLF